MSILEETLKNLKESQELAIFMREQVVDITYWGILTDYNDKFIYLSLIDMDGLPDGIAVFDREQLTRVRWDSAKLKSVRSLFDKKEGSLVQPDLVLKSIETILASVQKHFGYVGVNIEQLDDDALVLGEIVDSDAEYIIVREYLNKENKCASDVLLSISDITGIEAGDTYKEDILYINKQSKGN